MHLFFTHKSKTQKLLNQAMVLWLEDLEDLITLIQHDIEELQKDLNDLTDFVEDTLD